jgi:solute carrier family 36 (proton-coupled amino acid transporter)
VPQLGLAISLVGAVSSSALALLFPSICELILAFSEQEQRKVSWWLIAKDAALILLGVLGTITGTYCSLRDIFLAFTHPDAITGGH